MSCDPKELLNYFHVMASCMQQIHAFCLLVYHLRLITHLKKQPIASAVGNAIVKATKETV